MASYPLCEEQSICPCFTYFISTSLVQGTVLLLSPLSEGGNRYRCCIRKQISPRTNTPRQCHPSFLSSGISDKKRQQTYFISCIVNKKGTLWEFLFCNIPLRCFLKNNEQGTFLHLYITVGEIFILYVKTDALVHFYYYLNWFLYYFFSLHFPFCCTIF